MDLISIDKKGKLLFSIKNLRNISVNLIAIKKNECRRLFKNKLIKHQNTLSNYIIG
jgi:hypothetical protein